MRERRDLFKALYDEVMIYNDKNNLYDYNRIEKLHESTERALNRLKIEFYDTSSITFLCFNKRDTELLRLRYGVGTNGENYTPNKLAEKFNITPHQVNNDLEMIMFILKRRVIDAVIYMMDGIKPKKMVAELNLSYKVKKQLINLNIIYLVELLGYNSYDLQFIKGIGKISSKEIIDEVHRHDLLFKDEEVDKMINTESLRYVLQKRLIEKKEELVSIQKTIDELNEKKNNTEFEINELLRKLEIIDEKLEKYKK